MRLIFVLIMLALAGCASTPQASRERDSEARQFGSSPADATVYVYRPNAARDDPDPVLWVDGRLIGATLPYAYFRVHLDPGRHLFTGMAADNGRLELDTRPGEIYFVAQIVTGGQSHFQPVKPEIGRKVLTNCCSLLENWTPGQRPLLR